MDITRFEWEAILRYMGGSAEEIADVQERMGACGSSRPANSAGSLVWWLAVADQALASSALTTFFAGS